MRLSRVRLAVAAGVVALAAGGGITASVAVANAGVVPGVRAPAVSVTGYLYYVSGGYIVRVPVSGGSPHRMAHVGGASVEGITTAGGRLFWIAIDNHGNGSIGYVGLTGSSRARTLVNGLDFPVGLVSANGYLYWADQNAVGRVHPNGTSLTRRFIVLPQEAGGGVADGLATDGQHLYFSRCQDNEIGQVRVSGRGLTMRFVRLPAHACPQQLTVGNNHLYWAELAGFVGRATLHGGDPSVEWLAIHTGQGPFNVAADNANVYWDWGGVAGSPIHIGTARVDRGGFRASYLLGQGALYLTTPGAN
jgi:hypothetical protein